MPRDTLTKASDYFWERTRELHYLGSGLPRTSEQVRMSDDLEDIRKRIRDCVTLRMVADALYDAWREGRRSS